MQQFFELKLDEERALYGLNGIEVINCSFDGEADGESALKECREIVVRDSYFNLRYPFWHVTNAVISGVDMTENCRAALWYDKNITISDSMLHGIKALRECVGLKLNNLDVISPEFMWKCRDISIDNMTLNSEYPFFESANLHINNLTMKAKYSFQYVSEMTITDSNLDTKDAFWHSENVTVRDSIVKGEYLGWYSKNLTFINCTIIGTQPLCYCEGLKLIDCRMVDTDLSFERSEVDASVLGKIAGIKNPYRGRIVADAIEDILIEPEIVDKSKTEIIIR